MMNLLDQAHSQSDQLLMMCTTRKSQVEDKRQDPHTPVPTPPRRTSLRTQYPSRTSTVWKSNKTPPRAHPSNNPMRMKYSQEIKRLQILCSQEVMTSTSSRLDGNHSHLLSILSLVKWENMRINSSSTMAKPVFMIICTTPPRTRRRILLTWHQRSQDHIRDMQSLKRCQNTLSML